MKWSKIDYIKAHSRIDFDCDDALLEQYATAAEDSILSLCNRSYESFIDEYGEIPAALYMAVQLAVDAQYNHRTPLSPNNLSIVGYSFDLLIKPYMVLSGLPLLNDYNRQILTISDMRHDLDFFSERADGDGTLANLYGRIDDMMTKFGIVSRPTQRMLTALRSQTVALKADVEKYLDSIIH